MTNINIKLDKNLKLYSNNELIAEIITNREPEYYLNKIINGRKIDACWITDTTYEQTTQVQNISIQGLYFNYHGEKIEPHRVYFCIQTSENINGLAYCHYDNSLYPVYTQNGERLRIASLCNVIANYNGSELYNFRKE